MGFALYQAQVGGMPDSAKPLKGFGGAGVLEIVEDHRGAPIVPSIPSSSSARSMSCMPFRKKARKGIKTPQEEIDLVRRRLKVAEQDHNTQRRGTI